MFRIHQKNQYLIQDCMYQGVLESIRDTAVSNLHLCPLRLSADRPLWEACPGAPCGVWVRFPRDGFQARLPGLRNSSLGP